MRQRLQVAAFDLDFDAHCSHLDSSLPPSPPRLDHRLCTTGVESNVVSQTLCHYTHDNTKTSGLAPEEDCVSTVEMESTTLISVSG
jgi:hypothetical protein